MSTPRLSQPSRGLLTRWALRTQAVTTGHTGPDELEAALTGCDLVIIPAGVPRKPGMTRDDLFKINAGIVAGVVEGVAKWCPGAMINMISNPVRTLPHHPPLPCTPPPHLTAPWFLHTEQRGRWLPACR